LTSSRADRDSPFHEDRNPIEPRLQTSARHLPESPAVAQALIEQHQIEPSRLEGHGVGPLSPRAPNDTEIGKAKNHRVELVARQSG
jgi:hypothetical protein